MATPALATKGHPPVPWKLTVLLAGVAFVAMAFWIMVALPYFRLERERFGAFPDLFWPRRHELLVHIAGGTIALLVGPVQLWLGETRRHLAWHRRLGRLYVGGVAVGVLGAFYLALTTPAEPGWVYASGLFGLATAWTITTGMAVLAIRQRAIAQHREWMIRSYVVTLAFVFFRLFVVLLESFRFGEPVERYQAAAWVCWAVPLLITEPLLQWSKIRRAAAAASPSSGRSGSVAVTPAGSR
jgi:uncharacterized membrane protein